MITVTGTVIIKFTRTSDGREETIMEYKPTDEERMEMIEFTQRVADLFGDAAGSSNNLIAWHRSSWHHGLEATLRAAIKETYPDVDADRVFELMLNSGESIESSVRYWRDTDKIHGWCKGAWPSGEGKAYCQDHEVTFSY